MPFPATRAFAIFRGEPRRDSRPRIAAATQPWAGRLGVPTPARSSSPGGSDVRLDQRKILITGGGPASA